MKRNIKIKKLASTAILLLVVLFSGTVFQVGEEVRVTINLFQLPDRSLLWTKSTQQRVENLFQLHDDMVQKILNSLKITLNPSEESAIEDSISKNPKVYPMFLKANQLAIQASQWEKGRDLYLACLIESFQNANPLIGDDLYQGLSPPDILFRIIFEIL